MSPLSFLFYFYKSTASLHLYTRSRYFSNQTPIRKGIAYSIAAQIAGVIIAPGVIIIAVKMSCISLSY
jgi:hypothetical protein